MPRHSILSSTELGSLFEIPDDRAFMLQHYTLSDSDKSIVHQHRGASNKLGFAIQLCYMRYPGVILGINDEPFKPLLFMMAAQLSISVDCWNDYGQREQTRREHIAELKKVFSAGWKHQNPKVIKARKWIEANDWSIINKQWMMLFEEIITPIEKEKEISNMIIGDVL
jgi:hypothetical protein